MHNSKKSVVIVGGGFGGLTAAKYLKDSNFDILIIDKTNHHLFQPLLYQVATATLSPAEIAMPIWSVFSKYKNIKLIIDEVIRIDKENRIVETTDKNLSKH